MDWYNLFRYGELIMDYQAFIDPEEFRAFLDDISSFQMRVFEPSRVIAWLDQEKN